MLGLSLSQVQHRIRALTHQNKCNILSYFSHKSFTLTYILTITIKIINKIRLQHRATSEKITVAALQVCIGTLQVMSFPQHVPANNIQWKPWNQGLLTMETLLLLIGNTGDVDLYLQHICSNFNRANQSGSKCDFILKYKKHKVGQHHLHQLFTDGSALFWMSVTVVTQRFVHNSQL